MAISKIFRLLFLCILLTLVVFFQPSLFSQSKGFSGDPSEFLLKEDLTGKLSQDKLLSADKLPVGNIVVPEMYYVGPGDVFIYQNLSSALSTELFSVTPENTVLIPRIGILPVTGLTLAEVKDKILNLIKAKNPNAIAAISLYQPRHIVVNITGNVLNQGSFVVPASYRVSTAVLLANQSDAGKTSSAEMNEQSSIIKKRKIEAKLFANSGVSFISNYVSRNISLISKNGKSSNVDLEYARVTSNINYDPYLKEGDQINVPFETSNYSEISVNGEVIRPCRMPYKKYDKLSNLIKMSSGFTQEADPDNVFLVTPGGERKKVAIDNDFNLVSEDFLLEPGSALTVGKFAEKKSKIGIVTIVGNVANPGTYPIESGETKLKDAIGKAGGFTDEAYLPLAYIMRRDNSFGKELGNFWNMNEYFQYSDLSMQDTTRYFIDVNNKKPVISCDFVEAFEKNNSNENVPLTNGDLIIVPSNPKSVYVYGQVNKPGFVAFKKGLSMAMYIDLAGGFAVGADKARSRVIDGRTKVWKKGDKEVLINAGDEIYVPKPPDEPPGLEIQTYALIAGVLGSVAALVNVIYWIIKNK